MTERTGYVFIKKGQSHNKSNVRSFIGNKHDPTNPPCNWCGSDDVVKVGRTANHYSWTKFRCKCCGRATMHHKY